MGADMVDAANFVFNFQAEHIFADSLFGADPVGDFLRSMGYQKNALGNLMAEFSDADTVRKIQGNGGGFKLKWPAKPATLASAIAIIMASGFGALGAEVKKELNPKADLQKYSFDHRAKLRW